MHVHRIHVYYEDTDFTGVVYHANYLKYFERAREHLLGVDELVRLWRDEGLGFVVVRAELRFREGARHGDTLEVRTEVREESAYRLLFDHAVFRAGAERPSVEGKVELCTVGRDLKLTRLPESVLRRLKA